MRTSKRRQAYIWWTCRQPAFFMDYVIGRYPIPSSTTEGVIGALLSERVRSVLTLHVCELFNRPSRAAGWRLIVY